MSATNNAPRDGDYATVTVADTGVSVSVRDGRSLTGSVDVAAFSWQDGIDVERWARDYAAALNRASSDRRPGDG